jgi:hypothetical protein
MANSFNARGLQRMPESIRQILQDDPTGNVWKILLEHHAIMPNVPTNIHESGQLGIPALHLAFNGVCIQPATSNGLFHGHVLDKSTHLQWILREPRVRIQISIIGGLKYRVFAIGNVLVSVRTQESRHLLEQRTTVLKAVVVVSSYQLMRQIEIRIGYLQMCHYLFCLWSCQILAFLAGYKLVDTSLVNEAY